MAELSTKKKTLVFAGYISIAGAVSMLAGAALWGASETDLWHALASNQMESYLSQLEPVKHLLVANTFFWILGVLLMGTAVSLMSGFCSSNTRLAQLTMVFIRSAVPVAIVSFIIMLSLAIHPPALESAMNIGWIGTRLDDLATILIIGASPLFLSIAGKTDWVPGWLAVWGYLAGIAGLLGVISLLSGVFLLGFIILPFGIGWMIAAGVVLIRKKLIP
jgi:hypothetical protein